MTLYANFVANPSFEVNATGWVSENGGSLSRTASSPTAGGNVLNISYNSSGSGSRGGVNTTVDIEPGRNYTLSLTIKAISENHGAAYNAGVVITVFDLLPGQAVSSRQQVATKTVTSAGRTALRNFTPRATADRLVITVTSSSSYYQAPIYSTQTSGLVWTEVSLYGGGGGITSPSGTHIEPSAWDNYAAQGYVLSGRVDFIYRDTFASLSYNARQGTWNKTTQTAPAVNGGTVTFTVDAVQVEAAATESAYVDGTVAGYAWSGTPHASPTLAMAQAEAHAVAASTGTLIFGLILPLQAHGTAVSTGTLETIITALGASAVSVSTGRLDVWQYGPMSASGSVSQPGTIELAALLPLELSGVALSTGTAKTIIAVPALTTAFAISTGALDIGLPPDAEAHGTATSTGTLMAAIAGVMEAHGVAISTGTIELLQAVPMAAIADFSIFGVTETDPRMSVTANSNGGVLTGASGADWVRVHAEFAAPDEMPTSTTPLWRRAAFAVPGVLFSNLAAGSWQEVTNVQVEIASPSAQPTTYMDGASIRALVHPDRLNLAPGAITVVADNVFGAATASASPIAGDDAAALSWNIVPGTTYNVFTTLTRLKPMAAYTVSLHLRLGTDITDAGYLVRHVDTPTELAAVTRYSDGSPAPEIGLDWRRINTTFTAPASGQALMSFSWTTAEPHDQSGTIDVCGFLVEAGAEVKPYFSNPGTDPEIRYHSGFSNPSGGVFHYQDFERKTYILNRALRDHVASGIGVNEPEFNVIPHYDS